MAKALYPEAFSDVDPEKTYADFHKKYLPVQTEGTFFIQLGCGDSICDKQTNDQVDNQTTSSATTQAAAADSTSDNASEEVSWFTKVINWFKSLFA